MRVFILIAAILTFASASLRSGTGPELIGVLTAETPQTWFGEYLTPAGDQDGDGCADLWVSDGIGIISGQQYLFLGGVSFDSLWDLHIEDAYPWASNVGDIDGDGWCDLAALGHLSEEYTKLNLYSGGPLADGLYDLQFGVDTLRGLGDAIRGDDINGNGNPELITGSVNESGRTFKAISWFELGSDADSIQDLVLYPPNLRTPEFSRIGYNLIYGDYNGDGVGDLGASVRFGEERDSVSGAVYLYWGGPGFDTIPDMIITRPEPYQRDNNEFGELLEHLGDINADGFSDFLVGASGDDSVKSIFFGGPAIDDIPDITIPRRGLQASAGGDLNTDGYLDFLLSYNLPWSGGGYVDIYFGGPEMDSLRDVTINNADWEGYETEFGMGITGIGDWNGDGIDDFAFSALDNHNSGEVYIVSGWDPNVDVPYDYEPTLPDGYRLSHNYPNPFNPSTTIEFDLPRRSDVTLSVYNALGQLVKTFVSDDLAAGHYTLQWDGTDNTGHEVSSGVYFARMQGSGVSLTRKMVLVR